MLSNVIFISLGDKFTSSDSSAIAICCVPGVDIVSLILRLGAWCSPLNMLFEVKRSRGNCAIQLSKLSANASCVRKRLRCNQSNVFVCRADTKCIIIHVYYEAKLGAITVLRCGCSNAKRHSSTYINDSARNLKHLWHTRRGGKMHSNNTNTRITVVCKRLVTGAFCADFTIYGRRFRNTQTWGSCMSRLRNIIQPPWSLFDEALGDFSNR